MLWRKLPTIAMSKKKLVEEESSFVKCLARVATDKDAVMFYNESKEFKLMIRHVSQDEGEETGENQFELVVTLDPEREETLAKVLELEHDGYFDDAYSFVVHSFTQLEAEEAMALVNETWLWRFCACGKYFIKQPGFDACLFCEMTMPPPSQTDKHMECPVCLKSSCSNHMIQQSCCQNFIHSLCIDRWKERNPTCPLCRAVL